MVKIVLVTHGHLAQQMLETAGQIIGKPSDDGFATFAVTTAASVEKEAAKLHELLKSCEDGALILTDIFGGSAVWKVLQSGKAPDELDEAALREIVGFACRAAGLSTTKHGGISSVPAPEEVG